MTTRTLDWDGCYNVRDLGGLPTGDGFTTRGAMVRSAAAFQLTEAGWDAARAYGIRTVVDLMNPDEYAPDASPRPPDIATIRIPLDNEDDREFWDPLVANGHWGTALYYPAFLERYPDTVGRVLHAIARAEAGGVLFHCGRGQDRTGIVAMMLLAIAGVDPEAIADDYDLCHSPEVIAERAALGLRDDSAKVREIVTEAGTTNRAVIIDTVTRLDPAVFVPDPTVRDALRSRLTAVTSTM